jgi:hypothetical protein
LRPIPQLEGAEITPDTSPDASFQQLAPTESWSPHKATSVHSEEHHLLDSASHYSSASSHSQDDLLSLDWDYHDILHPPIQQQPPSPGWPSVPRRKRAYSFNAISTTTVCQGSRCPHEHIYAEPESWDFYTKPHQ